MIRDSAVKDRKTGIHFDYPVYYIKSAGSADGGGYYAGNRCTCEKN